MSGIVHVEAKGPLCDVHAPCMCSILSNPQGSLKTASITMPSKSGRFGTMVYEPTYLVLGLSSPDACASHSGLLGLDYKLGFRRSFIFATSDSMQRNTRCNRDLTLKVTTGMVNNNQATSVSTC